MSVKIDYCLISLIAMCLLVGFLISIAVDCQEKKEKVIDEIIDKQEYNNKLSNSFFLLRDIVTPFNQNDTVTIIFAPYVMTGLDDSYQKTIHGGFSFWVNHTVSYGDYIPFYAEGYNLTGKTSFQMVFGDYGEYVWIKECD